MKLTLDPHHPLAKAIVSATEGLNIGRVSLSVDRFERYGNNHRRYTFHVVAWDISDGHNFECELVEAERLLPVPIEKP